VIFLHKEIGDKKNELTPKKQQNQQNRYIKLTLGLQVSDRVHQFFSPKDKKKVSCAYKEVAFLYEI
jgi:hypothetical protein